MAVDILRAVERNSHHRFEVREGGDIGVLSEERLGAALSSDVADFCSAVFASGGAVLCGPGGGRFVYDLRARFDLFCKLTPISPLSRAPCGRRDQAERAQERRYRRGPGKYRRRLFRPVGTERSGDSLLSAFHRFEYTAVQVERILQVAIRLAKSRRGGLCLVVKPGGVPSISKLWMESFASLTRDAGLQTTMLEIDNATFQVIAKAQDFDVIVSPNMYGDILADCAALLLASRGMSYSGNFGSSEKAVYQTGHGAAHDLAGKDIANPIGQVCSLAMMLRESFELVDIASTIETAIETTLSSGWRTPDIAEPGSRVVGTRELGERLVDAVELGLAEAVYASVVAP